MRLTAVNRSLPLVATAALLLLAGRALAAEMPAVTKTDHVRGKADARITLVEYTDFQCPFCKRHEPTMQQLVARYKGQVNWVYRPFPLAGIHAMALPAAEAAECVAELRGERAFWRFHGLVFRRMTSVDSGRSLTEAQLPRLAASVGVPAADFRRCMVSERHLSRIMDSYNGGEEAGVGGTPTTFVVDNRTGGIETVHGAVPLQTLTAVIDAMLKGTWTPTPEEIAPEVPLAPEAPTAPVPPVGSDDHSRGPEGARYAFVEYGGAHDPFSRRLDATMRQLLQTQPDVKWVYRHYPLSFQPQSEQAAKAMECADQQGGEPAFWAMFDAVYAGGESDSMDDGHFPPWQYGTHAAAQGLSRQAFQDCFIGSRVTNLIADQAEGGTAAGVSGTPTTFLVDTQTGESVVINGAQPEEEFVAKLQAFRARR